MRYIMIPITALVLSGCTSTPSPQENKEIQAKNTIEKNLNEAHKAQAEYIALQKQREREGTL